MVISIMSGTVVYLSEILAIAARKQMLLSSFMLGGVDDGLEWMCVSTVKVVRECCYPSSFRSTCINNGVHDSECPPLYSLNWLQLLSAVYIYLFNTLDSSTHQRTCNQQPISRSRHNSYTINITTRSNLSEERPHDTRTQPNSRHQCHQSAIQSLILDFLPEKLLYLAALCSLRNLRNLRVLLCHRNLWTLSEKLVGL